MSTNDKVFFNISRDKPIERDLGDGRDMVSISHDASVSQIRLSFTSSEVGDGGAEDSATMANQDGDLAVRVRAESANGVPRVRPAASTMKALPLPPKAMQPLTYATSFPACSAATCLMSSVSAPAALTI